MAEAREKLGPTMAAESAVSHLEQAVKELRAAFDHPHHGPRLDQVESLLTGVKALAAELPQAEANRAEYAGRLLDAYQSRQLPAALPDHAELLLSQELQRAGKS